VLKSTHDEVSNVHEGYALSRHLNGHGFMIHNNNGQIKLTNLLTGETAIMQLENNNLECRLGKPAAFKFYKYEIIE